MLFNSYIFIFGFLPVTLILFFLLAKLRYTRSASGFLVVASLFFYAYWDIRYLPLLIGSILFNYSAGKLISRTEYLARKRNLLIAGIVADLLLLAYFKYTNFFLDTWSQISNQTVNFPEITLPLGISFFTFTQLAYLVDAYRGEAHDYDLLSYSLFVTFFPHLIAGPILDHKDVIPQFQRLRNFVFSHKNMAIGTLMFVMGLSKKVLIADNLADWVTPVFSNANQAVFISAWKGALAYTFQLYFDFSGYADMAIGLGLMLNIKLPVNFNSPYKATSVIDFWRRWHITLSDFLKNYLYIPLGGNRHGYLNQTKNLLITMLLGGLWHGAGWTYVAWGGLHGLYLAINHTWRRLDFALPGVVSWGITYYAVVVSWVFFRSNSMHDAFALLRAMMGLKGVSAPGMSDIKDFAILGVLLLWLVLLPNAQQLAERFKPQWRWALATAMLAFLALFNLSRISEFLYFQF